MEQTDKNNTHSHWPAVSAVRRKAFCRDGAKKVPERELLQEIRDALDAGASGVAMGRNIWGNEDPVRYAAAIAKLIHEDCSVDAALKEMNRLYGKRG